MILTASSISFSYPKTHRKIIDDFSIEINQNDKIGLVAPSGFGKTTLCKILAGYEKPDYGKVLIDGKTLPKKGYFPVQLIWQHPEQVVNPRLRMKDILSDTAEVPEYMKTALGLENEWFERYPNELSGGELQRFCIARALAGDTKFLIADEMTSMLDLITQSQLWHFVSDEIKKRKIGLIAVSHDPELLKIVTNKQIELDKTR